MSYTFTQTGSEIQAILNRAEAGGQIDQDIAAKQDQLTFDAVPTSGSDNPVKSGGIYDAIQDGGATALAAFATDSVSGDVASFPDGASNIPVKSFVGSIIPQQSGSGDPSPSNVRPISGWTGAEIYGGAPNYFDASAADWLNGKAYNPTGGASDNTNYKIDQAYHPITAGSGSITFNKGSALTLGCNICFYTSSKVFIERQAAPAGTAEIGLYVLNFTAPQNTAYFRLTVPKIDTTDICVTKAIPLTFGQTVYAGTITALGGGKYAIQPTHGIMDLATAQKSTITNGSITAWNYPVAGMLKQTDAFAVAEQLTQYVGVNAWAMSDYQFIIREDANGVIVRTDGTSAIEASGNLVYPLATLPDPIIVSAEDLATLLGSNTVWLDCGSVTEMEYRADTALYIQKLLNGGGSLSLSMAAPSPSLSLGRVGVLAEPEAEAVPEAEETTEEQEEQEAEEE